MASKTTASVQLEGFKELAAALRDVSRAEVRRILRRTYTALGAKLRDAVREAAPVRTGDLKRSIKSRSRNDRAGNVYAEVYVDRSGGRSGRGHHFHLVEHGTRNMSAQPFFWPTFKNIAPELQAELRAEVFKQLAAELQKRVKRR